MLVFQVEKIANGGARYSLPCDMKTEVAMNDPYIKEGQQLHCELWYAMTPSGSPQNVTQNSGGGAKAAEKIVEAAVVRCQEWRAMERRGSLCAVPYI